MKNKIGFSDIVALAKSGWTPEKVNETIDRLENLNQGDEEESHEDENESHEHETESHENESHDESESSESKEDEKDKKIKDLESKIENLQTQLSHQNNDSAEKKTVDDMVDDIFKEFFD